MRSCSSRKAFTLVELLIALTIFTLLVTVGVLSYLNLSLALKRENIHRKLYTEVQTVLDDMQQLGKFYAIDYDWYVRNSIPIEPGTGNTELVLISRDKQSRIRFGFMDQNQALGTYREKSVEGSFEPESGFLADTLKPLTSREIRISGLRFFLFPDQAEDPFQQKITVALTAQIDNPLIDDQEEFSIQTTFSSRLY